MNPEMRILSELIALASIVAGIAAFFAPIVFIARWILTPIDRAAKFRRASVRFSIGDFLCLFLAIQIPLAAVYRFVGPDEKQSFWIFTIVTWIIGPLIWFSGARALSKAGVMNGAHRFVFMGLIMPLVYYGLLPFTFLTVRLVILPFDDVEHFGRGLKLESGTWSILAILFVMSGVFTRYILKQVQESERPPINDPRLLTPVASLSHRAPVRLPDTTGETIAPSS